MGHSLPLFLYFLPFLTVDSKQMLYIKVCRWLDSNCGPLGSEVTTLPTEPTTTAQNTNFCLIEEGKYCIFPHQRSFLSFFLSFLRWIEIGRGGNQASVCWPSRLVCPNVGEKSCPNVSTSWLKNVYSSLISFINSPKVNNLFGRLL